MKVSSSVALSCQRDIVLPMLKHKGSFYWLKEKKNKKEEESSCRIRGFAKSRSVDSPWEAVYVMYGGWRCL